MSRGDFRFDVALSFPGEYRTYVEAVSEYLSQHRKRERIFYDNWYKAELARPNLDDYLQSIYREHSALIVVFLCAEYEEKQWCGLEWRAIRELIKLQQDEAIMPIRFDETEISGIFSIDGYISATQHNPEEIGDFILHRLNNRQSHSVNSLGKVPDGPAESTALQTRERALNYENPFGDRGCIRDPKRFFNRELLLDRIFVELKKGASLSVVGESQVGKSSILAMICDQGPQVLHLSPDQFIYLNMQIICNENEFFEALCDKLNLSEPLRGFRLAKALRGKRYIICIDEIEKMLNQKHFSGDERSELRGLADGADTPLSLLIASRSPLDSLFDDDPTQTSPLSGLCGLLRVKPFSQETTVSFITHRLHGNAIQFTPEQMQTLHAQTEGHPAKLQAAAAELYRQLGN